MSEPMYSLTEFASPETPHGDTLTLPYEARQKSRLLARTDGGVQVGLFLPRGKVLRGGDVLTGPTGEVVAVRSAPEALSVVKTGDALLFARACYHLGNRHVALQIAPGELRYLADHVLDEMVRGLGLEIAHESAPFEPEAGAYHGHGH
ncbi:urease accessory protein UreE [Methylomagnum ishizawai]